MSWIEAFLDYTENRPSPPLFRKWAAIAAVAGALERKVWVRVQDMDLFPNLYVLLVGPPAVGKTVMTSEVEKLWLSLEDHHVASSDIKQASLIDELSNARRTIVRFNGTPISFNSLLIASNELGTLLPEYDRTMMSALTDIWDGKRYAQKRRTANIEINMPRPQLNMLAGTTPSYLNEFMPVGAWDQGFISRVIMVYSGDNVKRPLFMELNTDSQVWDKLKDELKSIGELMGQMHFTEEAAETIVNWYMNNGPPQPDHPKLLHYCGRRHQHLLKLCMIASAVESTTLEVTIEHYRTALDWLIEVERYMPDIFRSMRSGGDASVIEEVWNYAYQIWIREKKPVSEIRLYQFVSQITPAHNVNRIVDVMIKAGILAKDGLAKGGATYKPKPKL